MFWFILLSSVASFLALWLVILFVISQFGWAKLAKHYPIRALTPHGHRLRFQSISINGIANYNGCVQIVVSTEGISLRVGPKWIFPFHEPIHIPWSDMEVVRVQEFPWLGKVIRGFVVDVGRPTVARLHLPGKVLQLAEELRGTTGTGRQESGT